MGGVLFEVFFGVFGGVVLGGSFWEVFPGCHLGSVLGTSSWMYLAKTVNSR